MNIVLLRMPLGGTFGNRRSCDCDGATEFQVLTKVYVPMSKSTVATVGLFFEFPVGMVTSGEDNDQNTNEWPLQVYIREYLEKKIWDSDADTIFNNPYAETSIVYAMVVCAIIPILIIYPYIQKYFAKGVTMGGVKE